MTEDKEEWQELGKRLRDAREYRGYSQQEIANLLDISRSSVSLIENGERKIDSIELKELADFYNISTDELIGDSSAESGNDGLELAARATEGLTPEDREEVLRFAEFLRTRNSGGGEDE